MNNKIIDIHNTIMYESSIEKKLIEISKNLNFTRDFFKIQSQYKNNKITMEKIDDILNKRWIDPIEDYWGAFYQRLHFWLLFDNAYDKIQYKYMRSKQSIDREILDLCLMYQLRINSFNYQQVKTKQRIHTIDNILEAKGKKTQPDFSIEYRMKRLTNYLFNNKEIGPQCLIRAYSRPFKDLQVDRFAIPSRARVMNHHLEGIISKNKEQVKKMNFSTFEDYAMTLFDLVVEKYNKGKTRFHSFRRLKGNGFSENDTDIRHFDFNPNKTSSKAEIDGVYWNIEHEEVVIVDAKSYSYNDWLSKYSNYGISEKGYTNMLVNSLYHGNLFLTNQYQVKQAKNYSLVYIFKEHDGSVKIVDMSKTEALALAINNVLKKYKKI